jgi:two-component system chemotaxis response regulator CheY
MNKKTDTKVIIVDDSDFSRSIIRKILVEEGYQVVGEANSAENAMLLLKDHTPDIIITDIVMPEISGIELTITLSKKFPEISIIVVSSLSQEHIVLEAISAGASDFIAKPIDQQQLIDSLEKIINNQT